MQKYAKIMTIMEVKVKFTFSPITQTGRQYFNVLSDVVANQNRVYNNNNHFFHHIH